MGMLDNLLASFQAQQQQQAPQGLAAMLGSGYEQGAAPPAAPVDPYGMLNDQLAASQRRQWGPFPAAPQPGINPASPTTSVRPSTNDPTAREPQPFVNGVPARNTDSPDPRSAPVPPAAPAAPAPPVDQATIPAAAQPTQGQMDTPNPLKAWADRTFTPSNAPTMMALAAGFAGAPSIGTGMRRAFSGATPAIALKQQQDTKQGTQAQTYRTLRQRLIDSGMSPEEASQKAFLAATNPEVMKAGSGAWLGTNAPKVVDVGQGMMGPTKGVQNPDGTFSPITLSPPSNVRNQPASFQRQVAPVGTSGMDKATNRPVVKQANGWVYADDMTPVPK